MTPPDVPRETRTRLERYVQLLLKWNKAINLIGDENDVWERHIWDSYQLLDLIPEGARSIVDMGTGAGLPGLVLAMAKPFEVTLVERDQRKASFLREAARVLELEHVRVREEDAASLSDQYDVITARALTSLHQLCELSYPRMGTSSICLFPKGENFATELEQAGAGWSFEHTLIPSKTKANASIVSITKLKRKG